MENQVMIKIKAPQKNQLPAKSTGKANIPPPMTVPAITIMPQNAECLFLNSGSIRFSSYSERDDFLLAGKSLRMVRRRLFLV